ncbi:hypothetical protein BDW74DRAFT_142502 [Aspergillus multicolor]|uniref:Zn(II)2Cys6 transcription factor domain-containing protein n=1 Tax=Aspergillus multicolor TaxID=41759 RepID=UPI003CCCBCB8
MPGVPSSRGCEACRRQKKKCDQLKPACTRCVRLQIACVGSGQKRFTFKEGYSCKGQAALVLSRTCQIPSNATVDIAKDFIEVLQVTDIRYDVTWYGPFLESLPRRIGSSPALDAAVGAVTSAVKALRTQQSFPDAMARYVKGWKALRTCLSDQEQTRSIHTVCAIYLMMICQSWVGRPDDPFANHGEILTQILNAAVSQTGRGQFEDNMIVMLSMPVVMQSIVDPTIPLGSWFWAIAKSYGPQSTTQGTYGCRLLSLQFPCMVQIAQWIRDPGLHLLDIDTAYNQLIADCVTMRAVLDRATEFDMPGASQPGNRVNTRPQVSYSMLICLALVLNQVIRIFDPNNIALLDEAADLVSETIWLARLAERYRPFGVSFMPVLLVIAWNATEDFDVRSQVQEILVGYETDFPAVKWVQTCYWMQNKYNEIRRTQLDALFAAAC